MAIRHKSRTNLFVVVLLSLFCIVLIGFGIFLYVKGSDGLAVPAFHIEGIDPNAVTGGLPDSPKSQASPDENQFGYRINTAVTFSSDGTNGDIMVENPEFNHYLMALEIADSNGVLLYQSQYIAPNQHIKKIDLQTQIEVGDYDVTAYISVIDPKTLDVVGMLERPITITVKG